MRCYLGPWGSRRVAPLALLLRFTTLPLLRTAVVVR